jgi:hypothetical protein
MLTFELATQTRVPSYMANNGLRIDSDPSVSRRRASFSTLPRGDPAADLAKAAGLARLLSR